MDWGTVLFDLLAAGLSRCQAAVAGHGGPMASLFLAGLVGGFGHCAGMCGPFVLAQGLARLEKVPASTMSELTRLAGAALVPYHAGRAITYAALGGAGAALAGGAAALAGARLIAPVLLGLAALGFIALGLGRLGWRTAGGGESGAGRLIARLARPLFADPTGRRGLMLGLVLGFLPCGLLYAALATAAATADPLAGALAMLAFAVGTAPALILVGFAARIAGGKRPALASRVAPVLMMANGGLLAVFAWQAAS